MKNNTYKTLAATVVMVALCAIMTTAHADNGPMGGQAGNPSAQTGQKGGLSGFFSNLFHRAPANGPVMDADATASGSANGSGGVMRMIAPGMKDGNFSVGTVTAVSGTTLTISGMDGTAYTVDASAATVTNGLGSKGTASTVASIVVGDRVFVEGTHSGTTITATKVMFGPANAMPKAGMGQRPGIIGTVASVSGTTITVTGKDGKTYTVDASAATFTKGVGKNATTISISGISTGDTIGVVGTVSGTNVTATKIIDGLPAGMQGMAGSAWTKPAASGKVTAVSGTTITVTGTDGTVYTVDASSATFMKAGAAEGTTVTIANISIGDTVAVEGTLSGTSVAATKIIDGVPQNMGMMHGDAAASGAASAHASVMAKIGSFFAHFKFW